MTLKEIKKVLLKEYLILNDKLTFNPFDEDQEKGIIKLFGTLYFDGKKKKVYWNVEKISDNDYQLNHIWYY